MAISTMGHAPQAAVSFFIPDNATRVRSLRSKLEARKAEHMAFLAGGMAQDFPDYRYRVGQILGLIEAIEFCLQAEKDEG
jgi:hypothetical protein